MIKYSKDITEEPFLRQNLTLDLVQGRDLLDKDTRREINRIITTFLEESVAGIPCRVDYKINGKLTTSAYYNRIPWGIVAELEQEIFIPLQRDKQL